MRVRAAARNAAHIGKTFDMGGANECRESGRVERSVPDGEDASYFATALTRSAVTAVAELPHELLI